MGPTASLCDHCPLNQICFYAATLNTQFIECCNGKELLLDCPATNFWDDNLKTCSQVKIDSSNPEVSLQPINICSSCPLDTQCYFTVESDPTKFIQCSNGQPVIHTCPTKLVFNLELRVCDRPKHVTYCDTQCPDKTCIIPSSDSYIQYFNCPDGLKECPFDINGQQTNFDPSVSACVCRECISSKLPSMLLPLSNSCSCPAGKNRCFYPGTTNTEFIECCKGEEHHFNCPSGYVWNINTDSCTVPFVVPQPNDPTAAPVPPTNICADCPWGFHCYFSTTDASKFIQCSNGQPVVHSCQPGLVWNSSLNVCDWLYSQIYCEQACPDEHCIIASPNSKIQYFDCPFGLKNCGLDKNGKQMVFDDSKKSCVCT